MSLQRTNHSGYSVSELVAVMAILAIVAILAAPAASEISRQLAIRAASNEVAAIFTRARHMAAFKRRDIGIRWTAADGDVTFAIYEDTNGNGVLSEEIRTGTDRLVAEPVSMKGRYPGITFSFLPGFAALDPGGAPVGDLSDPLRFGRSDICTFSPLGHSSPGSIYLSNGRNRQAAVRISPSSSRVQIFEWDAARKAWKGI